jgi:peptide deformylase
VVVEGIDQHGRRRTVEAEGLLARALQHEIDHTRGILFIDHLRGLRREMVRKRLRKQADRSAP